MTMGKYIRLSTPPEKDELKGLSSGNAVLLTGKLITGRDAAHKKMAEILSKGENLPFQLEGNLMYHMGPCPARPGQPIGPCGPTTSGRMDAYTPLLLQHGLLGIIGKGMVSEETAASLASHKAVYFAATGGAGTLYMRCVKSARVLAFPELGPEAVLELTVEDFPVIVAVDTKGNDLFRSGPEKWKRDAL